ncbi:MAG: hypothetical protein JKY01_07125 [Pseudomonadales bacterium]|nr:hypothetical protein [Pseudomonadales bacterium]
MKLLIYLILAIVVIFAYRLVRKAPAVSKFQERMPAILHNSRCIMNEQNIRTNYPVQLHGRVDQVFQLQDGRLLLVDTKNRARATAYPSDITLLSVYATILKANGYQVCPTALLRFPREKDPVYISIELYSETKIISLYHRYWKIKYGLLSPTCTCKKHRQY